MAAWGVLPPVLAVVARIRLRAALAALASDARPGVEFNTDAAARGHAAVVARACGTLAPHRLTAGAPYPSRLRPDVLDAILKPAMRSAIYDADVDWGGGGAAPAAATTLTAVDGSLMWAVVASELRAASTVAGLKTHMWAATTTTSAADSTSPLADAVLGAWVGDESMAAGDA
jgi:hypothetical protein